jgi:hypothetical protein
MNTSETLASRAKLHQARTRASRMPEKSRYFAEFGSDRARASSLQDYDAEFARLCAIEHSLEEAC